MSSDKKSKKLNIKSDVTAWSESDLDRLADLENQTFLASVLIDSMQNAQKKYPELAAFLFAGDWEANDGKS